MKKLSLIVAMAVVLTIGGVFATWNFSGGKVASNDDATFTIGVDATINDDKTVGEITVDNTIGLKIYNKDTTDKNIPGWTEDSYSGKIDVLFTADSLASNEVKDGVTLKWKVEVSTTGKDDYLTANSQWNTLSDITLVGNNTSATINASDVAGLITVKPVELTSINAYNDYVTAIGKYTITITVAYESADNPA